MTGTLSVEQGAVISSRSLTTDALALEVDGLVGGAGHVHGVAQLLGVLVGSGPDELNRRLQDPELEGHGHLCGEAFKCKFTFTFRAFSRRIYPKRLNVN